MIVLKGCFFICFQEIVYIYYSLESEKASADIFLRKKTFFNNFQKSSKIAKSWVLTSGKISLQMLSAKVWR